MRCWETHYSPCFIDENTEDQGRQLVCIRPQLEVTKVGSEPRCAWTLTYLFAQQGPEGWGMRHGDTEARAGLEFCTLNARPGNLNSLLA